MDFRQTYGETLARGCGVPEAELPWDRLVPVLEQMTRFLCRFGNVGARPIEVLALLCAVEGCVAETKAAPTEAAEPEDRLAQRVARLRPPKAEKEEPPKPGAKPKKSVPTATAEASSPA